MPAFLSVYAEQGLTYRPGGFSKRKGMFGVEEDVVVPTIKAKFEPIGGDGFTTNLIPGKNGRARGILYSEKFARQVMAQLSSFGEDIPPFEEVHEGLVKWLRNHRSNAANNLGKHLFAEVPEASEESLGSVTAPVPIDTQSSEVFEEAGDKLNCLVCNKLLDKRGRAGHLRSKEHIASSSTFDRRRRQALGV